MAHGLDTMAKLNAEAIEEHARKARTEPTQPTMPSMREQSLKRLLAAIDIAIAQNHLNPRSVIGLARTELGGIMSINEAEQVLWPNGR